MKNPNTIIAWMTSTLVLAVATISFILSYHALQGVASVNGLSGWLSFIWPLLVDFSLVVFSLCVVSAHLYSESTWKQWVLVSISTGLTVFYNALYAYPAMLPLLAQKLLVIGLPPIMLFFSFELLMSQLKNGIKRSQQINLITSLDTTISNRQSQLSTMDDTIDTLQDKLHTLQQQVDNMNAPKDEVSTRREKMITLIRNYQLEYGKPPTQQYLSEQTGVSIGTTRKDMKALNGVVK